MKTRNARANLVGMTKPEVVIFVDSPSTSARVLWSLNVPKRNNRNLNVVETQQAIKDAVTHRNKSFQQAAKSEQRNKTKMKEFRSMLRNEEESSKKDIQVQEKSKQKRKRSVKSGKKNGHNSGSSSSSSSSSGASDDHAFWFIVSFKAWGRVKSQERNK